MVAQPHFKFLKSQRPRFVQSEQERESFHVIELKSISIHSQEGRRHGYRDSLVAVQERMVLGQAFPRCSSFLNDVRVVTTLWSRQGGFERASVTDPECSSKSVN